MPSLPQSLQTLKAVVIGCADMRVVPGQVLGIEPGEAVVLRNIGGRVTPGLLEEFGLLGRIGEVAVTTPGGGGEFHLIVLHHTIAAVRVSWEIQPYWRTTFKYRKRRLRVSQSAIHASRWLSTLLRSRRFRCCRTNGSSQASSMTSRPDLSRWLYLQRQFVPAKIA